MLHYITIFNNAIWRQVFAIFKPFTDNVPFILLIVTLAVMLLISMIRKYLWKAKRIVFGPLNTIYLLSVSGMLDQLPIIHKRIGTALSVTSGIIKRSERYSNLFTDATGQKVDKSIVKWLYENKMPDAYPIELYEKFDAAMKTTRDLGPIRVDATQEWLILLVIPLLLYIIFMMKKMTWKTWVQLGILLFIGAKYNGTFLCLLFMLLSEHTLTFWNQVPKMRKR